MTLVVDIIERMSQLANDRLVWEQTWQNITTFALPDHARWMPGSTQTPSDYDRFARGPTAIERGMQRFDDTALRAVDRLASGMESLVTPQNDKWHGLAVLDPLAQEMTDEQKEYFDKYASYMFRVRYNPKSGFIGAHQKALRSAIALGTGITFLEENQGVNGHITPAFWRYLPLSECYLAVDAQGIPDTLYRKFMMTARQMMQRWGDKCAPAVQRAAGTQSQRDKNFSVIHAVQPNKEPGGAPGAKGAAYSSVYIDQDNQIVLSESGFYEFPFDVYYWQPVENMPYAQSPLMLAMADIKGLNAMAKMSLKGMQGYVDPPLMLAHDGITNRPQVNPGRTSYGMIDDKGRLRAQFLQSGARPDFVTEVLKFSRDNINDALYINLFQILLQNPKMTATEAMIRANEKGELLGPAGGKLQQAMAADTDRLAGIIERKGAMRTGAPLEPPRSLMGKEFGARFTSPLERLRRSAEGLGIQRSFAFALPLIQADPSVLDNYDLDEAVRTVNEIEGAPQKILKTVEERDAARQARQQQQATAAALQGAKVAGDAAKGLVPAMGQIAAMTGNAPATAAPQ